MDKKDKVLNKIKECINERNEQIDNLMSNTDYIEWLNKFTKDKKGFSSDHWAYFPNEISSYDRKNVEELGLFYEGIDKYAEQNHLYPTPTEFGNFYKIRLNKHGYIIGVLVGQGTAFYCKRVPVKNKKEFIDFNDIMLNKKQDNVEKYDYTLDVITRSIINAYGNGASMDLIINALYYTLNNMNYTEDKPKKLRKNKK